MKKLKVLFLFLLIFLLSGCTSGGKRLVQEGNRAFAKADYETALQNYLQAQNELPEQAEPMYNAANVSYRQQDYEAARQRLENALTLADKKLGKDVFYNLGNTYYQSEQYDLAVEAYKAVLRLNPDDQDAKYNLELALQKLEEQEQQEQQDQQDQQQNDQNSGQDQSQDQSGEENQSQDQSSGENQNDQSQSQNQDQQGQPSDEDQNQQSSDEEQTPENQDQAQAPDSDQAQAAPDSDQAQGGTPIQLTAEQARQLLEAAAQDTGSLQEFLQQYYQVPGTLVEKDW